MSVGVILGLCANPIVNYIDPYMATGVRWKFGSSLGQSLNPFLPFNMKIHHPPLIKPYISLVNELDVLL